MNKFCILGLRVIRLLQPKLSCILYHLFKVGPKWQKSHWNTFETNIFSNW